MADHVVITSAELSPGTMRSVTVGDRRLVVFRALSGDVSALEDRCSHAEVKLSRGTYENGVVTCPAHGAKFDACTGKQLCMPAVTPVPAFPTRIEGDNVIVNLPDD